MNFEFATATRISFGAGSSRHAATALTEFGRRALIVTGRSRRHVGPLTDALRQVGVVAEVFTVGHEPTTDDIETGVLAARGFGAEFVVGLGGGSAIDAGKAMAAVATNPGPLNDYLEVIGRAQPLAHPPLPYVAIPTTAGTGAEVTRNAVLASTSHRVKVSLRSPRMLPRLAVVDPELTYDLPPGLTATTGLDALTQLIEPYVSSRANPLTDALCVEGLERATRSLRRAVDDGHDRAAREDMAVASLFGGLALANAGLGAVHGFAGPIGGAFPAPHGAVCAALLPHVTATNLRALRARGPAEAVRRYDQIARIATGGSQATADDLVRWLQELNRALSIPALSAYGLTQADVSTLVRAATNASSMKANPLPLTPDELTATLSEALG